MPNSRRNPKRTKSSASSSNDLNMTMASKKRILDSNSFGEINAFAVPIISSDIPDWFNKRSSKKQTTPIDLVTPTESPSTENTARKASRNKMDTEYLSITATRQIQKVNPDSQQSQQRSIEIDALPHQASETTHDLETTHDFEPTSNPLVDATATSESATTLTPTKAPVKQTTVAPMSALEARRAKKAAAAAAASVSVSVSAAETITPSSPPKNTVESTETPPPTTKPVSALEARRAKRAAAVASEPVYEDVTNTMGPGRLPTRIYNSPSPLQSPSVVFSDIEKEDEDSNDDEDVNDEEFRTPMDLSEEDVDTVKENSMTEKQDQRTDKIRLKDINKLLDPTSVSTYSSKNVIKFKHKGEVCYCIGFEKGEQLVFIGHALIGSLVGSIDINGATISSNLSTQPDDQHTMSFFPVFSPRTSPLMVVRSIQHETASAKSSNTLDTTFSDLGTVLEPFRSRWDTFESVVVVKSLEWCGAEQLETILPTFRNLFRLGNKDAYALNDGPIYKDIAGFQPIVNMTPEVRALKIEPSWSQGVNNVLKYEQKHSVPSVSMICGTKNAGKSSFARYMINRLLKSHQHVAYLETDVGQTEFTPSGLVSLHIVDTPLLGPPFTHPNLKCKRSFYIGSTTPKNDPQYYQDCIHKLISVYREEAVNWMTYPNDNQLYHSLPLVVNTHGWVKGLGYELLFSLMDDVAPTHVYGFGCTLNASPGYSLPPDFTDRVLSTEQDRHLIQVGTPLASFNQEQLKELSSRLSPYQQYRHLPTTLSDKYKAVDLRQLMFISYMYHDAPIFGTSTDGQRPWWRTNLRLVDRIPYTVDWRHHLKGVWILFDDIPASQLLYALNGSLVGLVGATEKDDTTTIEKAALNETIPPDYRSPMITAPPNPSTTTCYGVGILRSIDAEQHRIHLLTPLPLDQLRQVTSLVKGDIDLPISCLFDQQGGTGNHICGIPRRLVPYVSQDVVNSIGSGTSIVRRNIMRRSQQN